MRVFVGLVCMEEGLCQAKGMRDRVGVGIQSMLGFIPQVKE